MQQTRALQNRIAAEQEQVGSLARFFPHARLPSFSSGSAVEAKE